MGQKKSNKIIIITIILIIILILLIVGIYTYMFTDILKSNKDLFFKYITQMGEEKQGFIEMQLKEYFEKQKTTPYINEGSASVYITSSNEQEKFKNTNNMNITFDGQVNNANNQQVQNISLNYSEQVKFPIIYKKIEDTIGIQTKYIGSKYVAINQESENELKNQGKYLEKIQKLSKIQLNSEEIQQIKDTYFNIINQQLEENNFSKIEESNNKGYKLTLKGEKLKNILVKLLESLKNDQATLDKLNEYIKIQKNSSKITTRDIDNLIEEINNNSELDSENLEITVYQYKGKTINLYIKVNEVEVKLQKILTGNDLQYNIEMQMGKDSMLGKIGISVKFAGLQSMQNITENYEVILEMEEIKYQYNYNNNIEFTENINIEGFNSNNSLLLNEMEEETRNKFEKALIQRIQSVNKKQMGELGIEENQNPLTYVIPSIEGDFGIYMGNEMSELEVTTYNKKFEVYESTNLKGVTVKGLLSTIQLNNETQESNDIKIKEIHFDGQEYEVTDQNITLLKSNVELETAYRVEFERDEETGIIYRAVINKK